MNLKLHVPGIRDMAYRQSWLADPATMSYNRSQDPNIEGYDAATGCIDFPVSDWRCWREVWLWREPERFSAYLLDEETGEFVGEVCYYQNGDATGTGVLIRADRRGRGYGAQGLKLLAERAFRFEAVEVLFAELPLDRDDAIRMYLSAGFREAQSEPGLCRLELRRGKA